jgi:hypothetical protein
MCVVSICAVCGEGELVDDYYLNLLDWGCAERHLSLLIQIYIAFCLLDLYLMRHLAVLAWAIYYDFNCLFSWVFKCVMISTLMSL